MKEQNNVLEDLEEELEDLEKERRELIFMQRKTDYGSPAFKSIDMELIRIDKKIFDVQEKKYQMCGVKMLLSGNRPLMSQRKDSIKPLSQSEMIKKHNQSVRNTKKKMLKLKGGFY